MLGYKFTVQNATLTGAGSNQVWAERVAGLYNISLCPRFNGTAFTPNTACNNYGQLRIGIARRQGNSHAGEQTIRTAASPVGRTTSLLEKQ